MIKLEDAKGGPAQGLPLQVQRNTTASLLSVPLLVVATAWKKKMTLYFRDSQMEKFSRVESI